MRTAVSAKTVPAVRPAANAITTSLWAALAIVFCFKVLRDLVTQTNFFDGLIYASLARNMAAGMGTVWRPHFTDSAFRLFSEHPPLMFWLQALGYRLFGDHIWVEKGYCFLASLISGALMLAIWRHLTREDPELKGAGPLALVLALVSGRLGWAYANNMLENTLIVFTSAAVYLIVRLYGRPMPLPYFSRLPLIVGAGFATFLAMLTKGPVGLFPLAATGLHWIAFRRPTFKAAIADTLTLLAVLVALTALLMQFPEPRAYADRYLHAQLFASLGGGRGSTGSRLHTLWSLVRVNFPAILVAGAIGLGGHFTARRLLQERVSAGMRDTRGRTALFLLLIGLSASAPLVASPRIYNFYFNASIPYFAAALAMLCSPVLLGLLHRLNDRGLQRMQWAMLLALFASLLVVGFSVGKPGPDKVVLGDVAKIGTYVCPETSRCDRSVAICRGLWEDWQLHAYLQRNFGISLFDENKGSLPQGVRFKIAGTNCPETGPNEVEIDLGLSRYRLLKR